MDRKLTLIGIFSTAIYIITAILFFYGRSADIISLKPNEIAEFLSGIFGPLTILWLILGFFQQGIELRQNTKVLELQAEELRNSVEQQRELVEATNRQVEAELEAIRHERERQEEASKARFVFSRFGSSHMQGRSVLLINATNMGAAAGRVQFMRHNKVDFLNGSTFSTVSNGQTLDLRLGLAGVPAQDEPLLINYVDTSGRPRTASFYFVFNESGALIDIVESVREQQS